MPFFWCSLRTHKTKAGQILRQARGHINIAHCFDCLPSAQAAALCCCKALLTVKHTEVGHEGAADRPFGLWWVHPVTSHRRSARTGKEARRHQSQHAEVLKYWDAPAPGRRQGRHKCGERATKQDASVWLHGYCGSLEAGQEGTCSSLVLLGCGVFVPATMGSWTVEVMF